MDHAPPYASRIRIARAHAKIGAMKLPVDEILVFGPVAVLAIAAGGRWLWLNFKYRHAP